MKTRPTINWGPIDANDESAAQAQEKFIETDSAESAIKRRYIIITGEKGSGKTALKRFLKKQFEDQRDYVCVLSFNDVEFSAIRASLNQVLSYVQKSPFSVLSQYWQYVITISAMRSWAEKETSFLTPSKQRIHDYLTRNGLLQMGLATVFLQLTTNVVKEIEKVTDPAKEANLTKLGLPSSLSPQIFEAIQKYPLFDPSFIECRKLFLAELSRQKQRVHVMMDEFDSIRPDDTAVPGPRCDAETIQLVFDSLMDACYSLSTNETVREVICIECMMPHDRYIENNLRDFDKIDFKRYSIEWNPKTLKKLVEKRISVSMGSADIEIVRWDKLFPVRVSNDCYHCEELSFEYLLRHTMYRPRQVLTTLEICESMAGGDVLSEAKFKAAVHQGCRTNVSSYLREYSLDHPQLERFLLRLKNSPNIMSYSEFLQLVTKSLQDLKVTHIAPAKKVEQLYRMGLFGVLCVVEGHKVREFDGEIYTPPTLWKGNRYECRYYYKYPNDRAAHELTGDDEVCIHPMFFDFCGENPDPSRIVG